MSTEDKKMADLDYDAVAEKLLWFYKTSEPAIKKAGGSVLILRNDKFNDFIGSDIFHQRDIMSPIEIMFQKRMANRGVSVRKLGASVAWAPLE